MTGGTVPGQAEASPLATAERDPSFNQEGLVFLREQGKVLKRETRRQQLKYVYAWSLSVQLALVLILVEH